jgi:hypothetical protein
LARWLQTVRSRGAWARTANAVSVNQVRPCRMPGATMVTAVALPAPAVWLSARTYSAAKPSGMVPGSACANLTCMRTTHPCTRLCLLLVPLALRGAVPVGVRRL